MKYFIGFYEVRALFVNFRGGRGGVGKWKNKSFPSAANLTGASLLLFCSLGLLMSSHFIHNNTVANKRNYLNIP